MKITEADVDYVAGLASLEVVDSDRKQLAEDLSRILDFVEQINPLDVTGIEPTPQIVTSLKRTLREDRVTNRTGSGEAGKAGRLFRVPRVITER